MRTIVAVALLLASGSSLHVQKGDECKCLPYTSVYENGLVCGQGYEFQNHFGKPVMPREQVEKIRANWTAVMGEVEDLYTLECPGLFEKMSTNKCAYKKQPTYKNMKQWCYVSQECDVAEPVEDTEFAIKWCTSRDDQLSTVRPLELNKLAHELGVSVMSLSKVAWAARQEAWDEMEASSDLPEEVIRLTHTIDRVIGTKWTVKERTDDKVALLQKIRDSGVVTVFSTLPGADEAPTTVIAGKETYALTNEGDVGIHYVCAHGCDA